MLSIESDPIDSCEQLKKDFPEIGQLEILIKRRPNQTGYIAQRADKQIVALSQQLLNDKGFSKVKDQHLDFYNQVKTIYIQQQEKSVSYER